MCPVFAGASVTVGAKTVSGSLTNGDIVIG
jgi:hypothetical protein